MLWENSNCLPLNLTADEVLHAHCEFSQIHLSVHIYYQATCKKNASVSVMKLKPEILLRFYSCLEDVIKHL